MLGKMEKDLLPSTSPSSPLEASSWFSGLFKGKGGRS